MLSSDAFISVNKKVLRFFKGDATLAVVLGELLAMYRYNTQRGSVDELNDSFPVPGRYLESSLALSDYKQHRALTKLEALNLLTCYLAGKPSSRWVILNFEAIQTILDTVTANPSADFYTAISEAAQSGNMEVLDKALDNMGDPLRSSVKLLTVLAIQRKLKLEWTGRSIGLLKTILRSYDKVGAIGFDYRRLKHLVDRNENEKVTSIDSLVSEMIRSYRQVDETPPNERIYNWKEL
jgi:hypothetical protein